MDIHNSIPPKHPISQPRVGKLNMHKFKHQNNKTCKELKVKEIKVKVIKCKASLHMKGKAIRVRF